MSLSAHAQKGWQKMNERYHGIKYAIPNDWRADPFSSSSVCNCAGTILDNLDLDTRIVIYPTDKEGMLAEERQYVWDYKFVPSDKQDKIKTEHFVFDRMVSKWEDDEGKDYEVWRISTHKKKMHYLIYVFGPPAELKAQKKVIHQILESIRPT